MQYVLSIVYGLYKISEVLAYIIDIYIITSLTTTQYYIPFNHQTLPVTLFNNKYNAVQPPDIAGHFNSKYNDKVYLATNKSSSV